MSNQRRHQSLMQELSTSPPKHCSQDYHITHTNLSLTDFTLNPEMAKVMLERVYYI